MFDELKVYGSVLRCAAGHPVRSLQTKDLECVMAHYVLFEGALYLIEHDEDEEDLLPRPVSGGLVLPSERKARLATVTADVAAYGDCDECDPVCFEARGGWHGDVDLREPWCEWSLEFVSGKLTKVTPIRLETRDDVRRKLASEGYAHIPDDDRIAKRSLEQWRKPRKPYV